MKINNEPIKTPPYGSAQTRAWTTQASILACNAGTEASNNTPQASQKHHLTKNAYHVASGN